MDVSANQTYSNTPEVGQPAQLQKEEEKDSLWDAKAGSSEIRLTAEDDEFAMVTQPRLLLSRTRRIFVAHIWSIGTI